MDSSDLMMRVQKVYESCQTIEQFNVATEFHHLVKDRINAPRGDRGNPQYFACINHMAGALSGARERLTGLKVG